MIALLLAGALAGVEITIGPDHPAPVAYTDEPLVVEVRGTESVVGALEVRVQPEGGEALTMKWERIRLVENTPLWKSVPLDAAVRGRLAVTTTFAHAGNESQTTAHVFRILRPDRISRLPAQVRVCEPNKQLLYLLHHVGAHQILLCDDGSQALLDHFRDEAVVALEIDPSEPLDSIAAHGKPLDRIDVRLGGEDVDLGEIFAAVDQRGNDFSVGLTVVEPEQLAAVTGLEVIPVIQNFTVSYSQLQDGVVEQVRKSLTNVGFENVPGYCRFTAFDSLDDFWRRIIEARAARLMPDVALVESTHLLNALAFVLGEAEYIGRLPRESEVQLQVFRRENRWVVAYWGDDEAPAVSLPVEELSSLTLRDGLNRDRPLPEWSVGSVTLHPKPSPQFLSGTGGPALAHAAWETVRSEAQHWEDAGGDSFESLPSPLPDVIHRFAKAEDSAVYQREEFFFLARMLRQLEQARLSGALTPELSYEVLSRLSRILQGLCVIEQERGTPFLEPLNATLNLCEDFQQAHRNEGIQALRGKWLDQEITRLSVRARRIAGEGRAIEASGVAAIAEWRARALLLLGESSPATDAEPTEDAA